MYPLFLLAYVIIFIIETLLTLLLAPSWFRADTVTYIPAVALGVCLALLGIALICLLKLRRVDPG